MAESTATGISAIICVGLRGLVAPRCTKKPYDVGLDSVLGLLLKIWYPPQRWRFALAHYRIYFLGEDDHIKVAHDVDSKADAAALLVAEEFELYLKIAEGMARTNNLNVVAHC